MSYRIKSVAALTGISATTLRAWERRYDLVSPQRTGGGYRVYDEEDIARLTQVKLLIEKGYKVGEAIELARRGNPVLPPAELSPKAVGEVRHELMSALLQLNHGSASRVFDRLAALPFDRQLDDVLLPLLCDVGELWEAGEASVAQEHFCSVFVRGKLAAMLESLVGTLGGGAEVVCAGAPDELHEFGLMAVAIHMAMRGWRITYLGADVPPADLRAVVRERRPVAVCSSLIRPRSADECLDLAATLRAAVPREALVVLGGRGLAPGLAASPMAGVHLVPRLQDLFSLPLLGGN